MAIITELRTQLTAVAAALGDDVDTSSIARVIGAFDDEKVLAVLSSADALARGAERLRTVAAGVVAARSTREAGHSGLAQSRGHRTPASLLQEMMGVSQAEARTHMRVGDALVKPPTERPWHGPLSEALLRGQLTSAQHEAILRGLGEPPAAEDDESAGRCREAWSLAATELLHEAGSLTVEAIRQLARTLRDRLDPAGAERRFAERYETRSFRTWTDQEGLHHGHFTFDDHGAAWVRSIIDAALRPRRGGPRFVDPDDKTRAEELTNDPRSNDQLSYDLMMDVLRAGSLAEAEQVFGARQPGVRLVQVESGPAYTEDGLHTVPRAVAEQQRCESGTLPCRLDARGNPLDLGREHRLFSSRQRIALALRDGGCRWRGCDRPASYCEAHHIDVYSKGGRTDIDRGILLCRFHHMQLHNGGWKISRQGHGEFLLHPPDDKAAIPLRQPAALRYAWAGIDPPPRRFRAAA